MRKAKKGNDMPKKWMIRSKKDGKSLFILESGELVFCQSVATCFPSPEAAYKMIGGFCLSDCYVVPVVLDRSQSKEI